MLNEAEAALGVPPTQLPFGDCPADRWVPPAIVATCTLARAERARRTGSRAEARALAEAAAALAPDEPRLLSRAAVALCQLGAVDRAAALVERARRSVAPGAQLLPGRSRRCRWAAPRSRCPPARSRRSRVRLLSAPASLAAADRRAGRHARRAGRGTYEQRRRDAGLASRARASEPAPRRSGDTIRAGLRRGLRARLDGKLDVARTAAPRAGPGTATPAAPRAKTGTLRALKQKPDPAFRPAARRKRGLLNLPVGPEPAGATRRC
jgi:hypothetical protein